MFSVRQKREIADKIQKVLRETNHPELPEGEISFTLHVQGSSAWSFASIQNNGAVPNPDVNPWNEAQDKRRKGRITRFCLECQRAFEQAGCELDFCCGACSLRYDERLEKKRQKEVLRSGEFNDLQRKESNE